MIRHFVHSAVTNRWERERGKLCTGQNSRELIKLKSHFMPSKFQHSKRTFRLLWDIKTGGFLGEMVVGMVEGWGDLGSNPGRESCWGSTWHFILIASLKYSIKSSRLNMSCSLLLVSSHLSCCLLNASFPFRWYLISI